MAKRNVVARRDPIRPSVFPRRERGKSERMEWWIWLLIILGALLLVGIIIVGGRRAQAQRVESKREEAVELRQDAQMKTQRAEERQSLAEEQAERAREERREADERLQRADDVDPDVDR